MMIRRCLLGMGIALAPIGAAVEAHAQYPERGRRQHQAPDAVVDDPEKPAPHLMRGGYQFSEKIMLKKKPITL